MEEFTVHGITFVRSGKCTNCGGCDSKCGVCPHGKRVDGVWYCSIYEKLGEYCETCTFNKDSFWYHNGESVNHDICKTFPNHPWIKVVRNGKCTYKFVRKDGKSMNSIPFVGGKY